MQSEDKNLIESFRHAGKSIKQRPDPPSPKERSKVGITIGLLIGLVYGLVSENINQYFLPNIPLAHLPFGLPGNIVFAGFAGGIMGYLAARPVQAISGIVLSAFSVIILFELLVIFQLIVDFGNSIPTTLNAFTLILTLSAAPVIFPATIVLRWCIDLQHENKNKSLFAWKRLGPILANILIAVVTGYLTLYPLEGRQVIISMNTLVQKGLLSKSATGLPIPLQNANNVQDFLLNASTDYSLELSSDRELIANMKPFGERKILVVARFKNGWDLACAFSENIFLPACQSY